MLNGKRTCELRLTWLTASCTNCTQEEKAQALQQLSDRSFALLSVSESLIKSVSVCSTQTNSLCWPASVQITNLQTTTEEMTRRSLIEEISSAKGYIDVLRCRLVAANSSNSATKDDLAFLTEVKRVIGLSGNVVSASTDLYLNSDVCLITETGRDFQESRRANSARWVAFVWRLGSLTRAK